MNISVDLSINLNKYNPSSIESFFQDILVNFNIKYYEDYEFDNSNKIQRNHKIYIFLISCVDSEEDNSENQFHFWSFIYQIKKIKGISIESIFDNDKNKVLYSSSYYRNYLGVIGNRKRTRSYSESDAAILENFLKIHNL
jgi:hypothetical protein